MQICAFFPNQKDRVVDGVAFQFQDSFRSALDACAEMLDPLLEKPLLDVLFKAHGIGLIQGIFPFRLNFAQKKHGDSCSKYL